MSLKFFDKLKLFYMSYCIDAVLVFQTKLELPLICSVAVKSKHYDMMNNNYDGL